MNRDYGLYIEDILDAIRKIAGFIEGVDFDEFVNNDMTSSAVVMKLIIIGEAAKNIPSDLGEKYSNIPWKDMARMRDKISHGYFAVNYHIVWEVLKEQLPLIEPKLAKMKDEIDKI